MDRPSQEKYPWSITRRLGQSCDKNKKNCILRYHVFQIFLPLAVFYSSTYHPPCRTDVVNLKLRQAFENSEAAEHHFYFFFIFFFKVNVQKFISRSQIPPPPKNKIDDADYGRDPDCQTIPIKNPN